MKVGAGSPQLQSILLPGEDWKLVAEGYKFTEGPAVNAKGEVFFNEVPNSKTFKVDLRGKVTEFLADTMGELGVLYRSAPIVARYRASSSRGLSRKVWRSRISGGARQPGSTPVISGSSCAIPL